MCKIDPEEDHKGAWCSYHDVPLSDVADHELDFCSDQGWTCEVCPYFADYPNQGEL